ncbi:MAG: hypothetical protein PHX18_08550 [Candidatus Gastranaerophilales bacterium]|nr:hypothetical protein [Candidatus Gastranaerophilales bacterium]
MQVNNNSSVSFEGAKRAVKPKASSTPKPKAPKAAADVVNIGAEGAAKTTLRQKMSNGVKAVKDVAAKVKARVEGAAIKTGKYIQEHTPKKLVGFFETIGTKTKSSAKAVYNVAKKPFVVGVAVTAAAVAAATIATTKLLSKRDAEERGFDYI